MAMNCSRLLAILAVCGSVVGLSAQASPPARLDAAMRAFWDADEAGDAEKAAKTVVASGASFDEIRARLKAGRPYAKQKTGRIEMPTRDHGLALDNIVEVPAEYDPARAWPLRVSLHGGVGREAPGPSDPPARPLTNRIQSDGRDRPAPARVGAVAVVEPQSGGEHCAARRSREARLQR